MGICSSPAAAGRLKRGLNNPGKTKFDFRPINGFGAFYPRQTPSGLRAKA
jgi:hypothetical protein